MLGGEDFYDWQVTRTEGMRKSEIFELLDRLEEQTRDSGKAAVELLTAKRGQEAQLPWNFSYFATGDLARREDPYFPFAKSFARWVETFTRLGVDYREATMVLDLLDRKGKYENGFMHGPVPGWVKDGEFRPARIHFTANAVPGMVGAGVRATATLFHEGGHAAHFSNITMPAPCFAQEFAPSSVPLAETQSMFLESLLEDADWRTLYARDMDGNPMPGALIEEGIRERQPFAARGIRGMMMVPYAERAIYELPEEELTPDRVLNLIRSIENKLLSVEGGATRPILSIPHLLSGESSAYYHGYVLAEMAVHQTRHFFMERDGYLTDNPSIGPMLRDGYWREGNIRGFLPFVESMTGAPLTSDHLAKECNKDVQSALQEAKGAIAAAAVRQRADLPMRLNASIKVMDGHEVLADSANGLAEACAQFEQAILARTTQA